MEARYTDNDLLSILIEASEENDGLYIEGEGIELTWYDEELEGLRAILEAAAKHEVQQWERVYDISLVEVGDRVRSTDRYGVRVEFDVTGVEWGLLLGHGITYRVDDWDSTTLLIKKQPLRVPDPAKDILIYDPAGKKPPMAWDGVKEKYREVRAKGDVRTFTLLTPELVATDMPNWEAVALDYKL